MNYFSTSPSLPSFKSLLFHLVVLISLLWFESSLGLIFLSFLVFDLVALEENLLEWLILGFFASGWLSTWFGVSWWLTFLFMVGIALASFGFKKLRLRWPSLLASLLGTGVWLVLAQTSLSPSLLLVLGLEFCLVLIFIPRNKL